MRASKPHVDNACGKGVAEGQLIKSRGVKTVAIVPQNLISLGDVLLGDQKELLAALGSSKCVEESKRGLTLEVR